MNRAISLYEAEGLFLVMMCCGWGILKRGGKKEEEKETREDV